MNVLVVGSGGREHSIVWKLLQELGKSDTIYVAPGNGGTKILGMDLNRARLGTDLDKACVVNVPIKSDDLKHLTYFARNNDVDLTIVGPEAPLAAGIVDAFSYQGLNIFGPTKIEARIESSKSSTMRLASRLKVPIPEYMVAEDRDIAMRCGRYFLQTGNQRGVVKADGLAAGKGVKVYSSFEELEKAVNEMMRDEVFGSAGKKVILQRFLEGEEASFIVWTDGKSVVPLIPTQDHKRAYDGDKGPNTGGMGAYTRPNATRGLEQKIMREIIHPVVETLPNYRGILYAGLMVVNGQPYLLEFNCRYGDPETQAVMPLLKSSLLDITNACIDGRLDQAKIEWHPDEALCVVLATKGYPDDYSDNKGKEVYVPERLPDNTIVYHAGTALKDGKLVNSGGRVLNVVGKGKNLPVAYTNAYRVIGHDGVHFDNMHFRKDIGWRTLGNDFMESVGVSKFIS
ncbi:MAG: phosphoribosylamine--glycine ligase [Candidatus Aenigmarchaeota archaeon]|nr:phosphoribosylamine--glycine ligase [Candidatus Aenigmarchaeota archaeon]